MSPTRRHAMARCTRAMRSLECCVRMRPRWAGASAPLSPPHRERLPPNVARPERPRRCPACLPGPAPPRRPLAQLIALGRDGREPLDVLRPVPARDGEGLVVHANGQPNHAAFARRSHGTSQQPERLPPLPARGPGLARCAEDPRCRCRRSGAAAVWCTVASLRHDLPIDDRLRGGLEPRRRGCGASRAGGCAHRGQLPGARFHPSNRPRNEDGGRQRGPHDDADDEVMRQLPPPL